MWAVRFSKPAVCALYIFVYVLSDSMLFVYVLPNCVHSVHCMCADFDCAWLCCLFVCCLTVGHITISCICAVCCQNAVNVLSICVLIADFGCVRALSACVCVLFVFVPCLCIVCLSDWCLCALCMLFVFLPCMCTVCLAGVCVLSVLFAVYVCCLSVYEGCLLVSVYAEVLVWCDWQYTIPLFQ